MKLNKIANIYSGYAFKEFNNTGTGRPVIKISNITKEQTINKHDCEYSIENVNEKYLSKPGDLYIALSGATTGKLGIIDDSGYLINQRVGIIRIKNNNYNPNFLRFYLTSKITKILNDAYGSAQPNISPKQIEQYEINENLNVTSVTTELCNIEQLLIKCKQSLHSIDELIKSRFIGQEVSYYVI